jgi:demethylmenaquinone methyltransferase/2-methoxy-6-polyprenyl-1,4-benzoquinol methylase
MWSYVYMKLLERRPHRYDARMERASRGRSRAVKEQVAERVAEGLARPEHRTPDEAGVGRVLELGCGTGELAARLARQGLTVHGFDANANMVGVARERIQREGLTERVTVEQRLVADMDGLPDDAYDAVVSTLVLSELDPDARRYTLEHAHRVLRVGGLLVIADEVWPRRTGHRALHRLSRAPALALTYLVTGSASHPLRDLAGEIAESGFAVTDEQRSHRDAFALVTARRTDAPPGGPGPSREAGPDPGPGRGDEGGAAPAGEAAPEEGAEP